MKIFFSVKVSFRAKDEKGCYVKERQVYWVDALSFTEAEARMLEYLEPTLTLDVQVLAIKKERIEDVMNGEGEKWYKVTAKTETVNEKTGKVKVTKTATLVKADTTKGAQRTYTERTKWAMLDEDIEKVEETGIVDVVFYETEKETEETR